jgi:hypothetical protein
MHEDKKYLEEVRKELWNVSVPTGWIDKVESAKETGKKRPERNSGSVWGLRSQGKTHSK